MQLKEHSPLGGAQALRILIADRSSHYRETVRRVLGRHAECRVIGEAESLAEAVRTAQATDPHIAFLDVDLVINQDPARLRRLQQAFPQLHVVVMLNEYSQDYIRAIEERWGYSCIAKDQAQDHIEALLSGRRVVA